ncbi:MAG: hypothetical protein GY751_22355 [Bacteroidetes bacterium]|nr:hypothetical protein [Bacteroidota bacterium]
MKNSIAILIAALTLIATSCVDVPELSPELSSSTEQETRIPDFDPSPSADLVITHVNTTHFFDQENEFEVDLDIDQDGYRDFILRGSSIEDENSGFLHAVAMHSVGGNQIGFKPSVTSPCNQNVTFSPIRSFSYNQTIGFNQDWDNMGVIYLMSDYDDCESSQSYTNMGQTNYFGLKIRIGNQYHYGWLEVESSGFSRMGFPNCSSSWKIKKFAYNASANAIVRTPQ